jgi:hypothetical protein
MIKRRGSQNRALWQHQGQRVLGLDCPACIVGATHDSSETGESLQNCQRTEHEARHAARRPLASWVVIKYINSNNNDVPISLSSMQHAPSHPGGACNVSGSQPWRRAAMLQSQQQLPAVAIRKTQPNRTRFRASIHHIIARIQQVSFQEAGPLATLQTPALGLHFWKTGCDWSTSKPTPLYSWWTSFLISCCRGCGKWSRFR